MIRVTAILVFILILSGCGSKNEQRVASRTGSERIPILIDSDANNELDDQHAIAYALASQDTFNIVGITVNNTRGGDGIEGQYKEALRVMQLFNEANRIPLLKGATGSYSDIAGHVNESDFDGKEAVDFIIDQARKDHNGKLVLVPVGKLTNIALALTKAPDIVDRVRIVWLGSNFPDPGEYNLDNDTTAINPVINTGVDFEMVVVRWGKGTGSHSVSVSKEMIETKLKGRGPTASSPTTGRHGGEFSNFGDYSVNLFSHIKLEGDPPSRALYDVVALAIVKNPAWGVKTKMPPSRLKGYEWVPSDSTNQNAWVWDNFFRDPILTDFFNVLESSGSQR